MNWKDILKKEEPFSSIDLSEERETLFLILKVFDDLGKDSSLSHKTITAEFPPKLLREKGVRESTIKSYMEENSGYDSPQSFVYGESPQEVIQAVDDEFVTGLLKELKERQGKFGKEYVAYDNMVPSSDWKKNSGKGMEFFLQLNPPQGKSRFMSGFEYNAWDDTIREIISPYILGRLKPYQQRYANLLR